MKTLFISDTHGYHNQLLIEDNTEMIIHSGDAANYKDPYRNLSEMRDFLNWFEALPIKYKIFVAGNHDSSVEQKLINPRDYPTIIYLEHESVEIEEVKIFGSPYTPEFCNWSFNVRRDKLHDYWEAIPLDTNILVTHGPPKGILDIAFDNSGKLEYCGDKALWNKVKKVNPDFHCFGHIHNNDDNLNSGHRTTNKLNTIFINASCVTDAQFNRGLTSQGIYFNVVKGQQSAGDK